MPWFAQIVIWFAKILNTLVCLFLIDYFSLYIYLPKNRYRSLCSRFTFGFLWDFFPRKASFLWNLLSKSKSFRGPATLHMLYVALIGKFYLAPLLYSVIYLKSLREMLLVLEYLPWHLWVLEDLIPIVHTVCFFVKVPGIVKC